MTPTRLAACLAACDWSVRGVARRLGYSDGAVRQWLDGRARVPAEVAAYLDKAARYHERNPPPVRGSK